MAFKSIFKKLYTEYLSKYGYVYVAKFDVFVRVKNELIFFIGQKSVTGPRRGIKAFNIYAGIYTVYRDEIIKYRFENALKLDSYMWDAEGVMGISEDDIQKRGKLMSDSEFIYYDDNSTVESCLSSLEKVSRYILPVFENVMDLNSFIIYSLHYSPQNLWGG